MNTDNKPLEHIIYRYNKTIRECIGWTMQEDTHIGIAFEKVSQESSAEFTYDTVRWMDKKDLIERKVVAEVKNPVVCSKHKIYKGVFMWVWRGDTGVLMSDKSIELSVLSSSHHEALEQVVRIQDDILAVAEARFKAEGYTSHKVILMSVTDTGIEKEVAVDE